MAAQPLNHMYAVPSQEGPIREPLETPEPTPEKRRPIIPGEAVRAYERRTQQLQEEASRLAMSSTPLFAETVREFAARPGPESAPEMRRLAEVGREIKMMRGQKVPQLVSEIGRLGRLTHYFGLEGDALYQKVMTDLIEEEAHIGGSVYSGRPKGQTWRFYYDSGSGMDEWFFTRTQEGKPAPFEVLRYIVQPNGVIRKNFEDLSVPVEGEELKNFFTATELYLSRVDEKIYHTGASKPGVNPAQ